MFSFSNFTIFNLLDILAVALLLYVTYRLVKGTVAINIFFGLLGAYFLWRIVDLLEMDLLSAILGAFFKVGFLALIIIFQPEIRRFLLLLGSNSLFVQLAHFFGKKKEIAHQNTYTEISIALQKMAREHIGVLIVLQRENDLMNLVQKGDKMEAKVTAALLESIFYPNSPLHDGAVIIVGDTITSTRTILPVSYRTDIPARLGLRHRAAIGITEKSDAISLVVSEEQGLISYVKQGKRRTIHNIEELKILLNQ